MTRFDDIDRALAAFLEAESAPAAPAGLVEAALAATARRQPRPTGVARLHAGIALGGWRRIRPPEPVLRRAVVILLLAALVGLAVAGSRLVAPPRPAVIGEFADIVPLRSIPGPMAPLRDGQVLVFSDVHERRVDTFDPVTGAIVPIGEREFPVAWATALANGEILLISHGEFWMTIERFDPASGTTTIVGRTASVPVEPVTLADGRILIPAMGAPALVYDPASASLTEHLRASTWSPDVAVPLPDGRAVLLAVPEVELFDPRTGMFAALPPLPESLWAYTATALPDGRVLVLGGATADAAGESVLSARIWSLDPGAGTWLRLADLPSPRWMHAAILLSDGRVLVVGGDVDTPRPHVPSASTVYVDAIAGTSVAGPPMGQGRLNPRLVTLADGRILVVGSDSFVQGVDDTEASATTEIFR